MRSKEETLSEMILRYLQKHPGAGDTLEGITKWWLALERIEVSVDEIARALDDLIEEGLVAKCELSGHECYGSKIFYKINK